MATRERREPAGTWSEEVDRILRESGFDDTDKYIILTRNRILTSIALAYWKFMVDFADRNKIVDTRVLKDGSKEFIEQAIGSLLGVHPSTTSRWVNERTVPDADKIFGTLVIILKKEIDEIGFPRNREIIWSAVNRTLSLIREKELGIPRGNITFDEFLCVRMMITHPSTDTFLSDPHHLDASEFIIDMILKLRNDSRHGRIIPPQVIRKAAVDWFRPYAILRIGLPHDWGFLDGEVAL